MAASDKDCEIYARECVRLANLTTDANIRDSLLQMAREWRSVVMRETSVPEVESLLPQQ